LAPRFCELPKSASTLANVQFFPCAKQLHDGKLKLSRTPQFAVVVQTTQVQALCRTELEQVSCTRHVHFALKWRQFLLCEFHIYMNRSYAIFKQRLGKRLPVVQGVTRLSFQQAIFPHRSTCHKILACLWCIVCLWCVVCLWCIVCLWSIVSLWCIVCFQELDPNLQHLAYKKWRFDLDVWGFGRGPPKPQVWVSHVIQGRPSARRLCPQLIPCTPGYTQNSAVPVRPFQILCFSWRSVLVVRPDCFTGK
jgi:hypothetical protein